MRKFLPLLVCLVLLPVGAPPAAPLDAESVKGFVGYMAEKYGFDAGLLTSTFAQVSRSDRILELIARPAEKDRKSTRLNSSHIQKSRMPSSA